MNLKKKIMTILTTIAIISSFSGCSYEEENSNLYNESYSTTTTMEQDTEEQTIITNPEVNNTEDITTEIEDIELISESTDEVNETENNEEIKSYFYSDLKLLTVENGLNNIFDYNGIVYTTIVKDKSDLVVGTLSELLKRDRNDLVDVIYKYIIGTEFEQYMNDANYIIYIDDYYDIIDEVYCGSYLHIKGYLENNTEININIFERQYKIINNDKAYINNEVDIYTKEKAEFKEFINDDYSLQDHAYNFRLYDFPISKYYSKIPEKYNDILKFNSSYTIDELKDIKIAMQDRNPLFNIDDLYLINGSKYNNNYICHKSASSSTKKPLYSDFITYDYKTLILIPTFSVYNTEYYEYNLNETKLDINAEKVLQGEESSILFENKIQCILHINNKEEFMEDNKVVSLKTVLEINNLGSFIKDYYSKEELDELKDLLNNDNIIVENPNNLNLIYVIKNNNYTTNEVLNQKYYIVIFDGIYYKTIDESIKFEKDDNNFITSYIDKNGEHSIASDQSNIYITTTLKNELKNNGLQDLIKDKYLSGELLELETYINENGLTITDSTLKR